MIPTQQKAQYTAFHERGQNPRAELINPLLAADGPASCFWPVAKNSWIRPPAERSWQGLLP